jgi:hypothetical protein
LRRRATIATHQPAVSTIITRNQIISSSFRIGLVDTSTDRSAADAPPTAQR